MNISRLIAGAFFVCALPVLAQPDQRPTNGLPYPVISLEEAAKLGGNDKPIALHLRDVTLRQALEALQQQSGVTLDSSKATPDTLLKKLSLDLETNSFLDAFKTVLEEAGVKGRLEGVSSRRAFSVVFGASPFALPDDAPQSGVEAFKIFAVSLNSTLSKRVKLGKTPTHDQELSVNVEMGYELDPLLPVVGNVRWRVSRAEDEKGRSLKSDGMRRFGRFQTNGPLGQGGFLLASVQPDSRKVVHLDGAAIFVLSTKSEKWEENDVVNTKNLAHTFRGTSGNISVAITGASQSGNTVQLDIQMTGRFGNAQESEFTPNQIMSALRLVDATGQQLSSSGYNGNGTETTFTVKAKFVLPGDNVLPLEAKDDQTRPIKLILDVPVEFVQTEVPFSFSDLPLP